MRKVLGSLVLGAAAIFMLGAAVPALAYPSKSITIIVPYAAGGSSDMIARVLGERLKQIFDTTVVVENKPGASGIIALEGMSKSTPDGHTLMLGNVTTNAITPLIYKDRLSFPYANGIQNVSRIAQSASFIVATTRDFPVSSLEELIEYGKKHPGELRYSSAGVASFPHFDAMMLFEAAGIEATHLPSKEGAAGMMNALVNGDAHVAFVDIASSIGLVKEGKLRPLAVITEARIEQFPDVPTLSEKDFAGIGTYNWQALFTRAGTPREVVNKLNDAIKAALESDEVKRAFEGAFISAAPPASPEETNSWMESEQARWAEVISAHPISE